MEHLISKYFNDEVGQIIYAGVGHSPRLDSILSLEYKSLLLIEPIEAIAEKLDRKLTSDKVSVKNIALSPAGGLANFTVMQPAKYSSLQKDITLEHVLKNSAVISVKPMQTISLANLIKESKLVATDNNILILSINGSEYDCLDSVELTELTLFSTLVIQIENQGIYTECIDSDEQLKSLLRGKCFYFEDMQQEGAIFANLVFKRDDAMLDCIADLQQLERKNQEERSKINNLLAERETHKAEFTSSISQLKVEKKQLAEQQVETQQQTEMQRQESAKKVEQLQTHLIQIKQNKEAEKAELIERTLQLEANNSELATRSSKLEVEKQQLAEQKANAQKQSETQKQELSKNIEQLQNQLAEVKNNKDAEKEKLVSRISQLETWLSQLELEKQQLAKQKVNTQKQSEMQKQEFSKNIEVLQNQLTQVKQNKEAEKAEFVARGAQLEAEKQQLTEQKANTQKQSEEQKQEFVQSIEQLQSQLIQLKQNKETEKVEFVEHYSQLEAKNSELAAEKQQTEALSQELTQKIEQLQNQLERVKQNEKAEKAELVNRNSQLDTQLRVLQSKQDELVKNHSNKDIQINTLTEQRDKETEYNQKNKLWAESLKGKKDELESQNSDLVVRYSQLEEQNSDIVAQSSKLEASYSLLETSLTEQLSKAKNNLEERQRHSDLTQKLYAKAQIDLDHLRQQYQQKHNNEQQLVDLIKELRSKLQHAANFYHLLENEHPELLPLETLQYSDNRLKKTAPLAKKEDIVTIGDTSLNDYLERPQKRNHDLSNSLHNKKSKKKRSLRRKEGSIK